jgi:hypothetical protein
MKGYVNSCGRLNLNTGKNAHFNVLTDWVNTDTHITLFKMDGGKLRAIGGWGAHENGATLHLLTNTHRHIGYATVVHTVPTTAAGLAELKNLIEENTVTFGTWD